MTTIGATVIALILANTPADDAYHHLQHLEVGPAALGLHLGLETWAADGLLTIFFFVAGLELKRELVAGEMRDTDRFTMLSRQYLNRFMKSIYAQNYVASVGSTVARFGLAEDLRLLRKYYLGLPVRMMRHRLRRVLFDKSSQAHAPD